MNAFNLEPIAKGLVLLHSNLHDSAAYSVIPDYIAKTNEKGYFYDRQYSSREISSFFAV